MASSLSEKYQKAARTILEKNLGVKKGNQVYIHAWDHTLEAAGAMLYEARRLGANPVIEVVPEDGHFKALRELDASVFRVKNGLALAIAGAADVDITFAGPKDPKQFKGISYEKFALLADPELAKQITTIQKKRRARTTFLTIGHVTEERAKTYGLEFVPWRDHMLEAMAVDPAKIAKVAAPVMAALKKGKAAKLTSENGSVLKLKLAGRDPTLDDGVLRPEDIAKGDNFVHIPAGVVFSAPAEGSAEGRITYDMPQASRGKLIKKFWIDVKKGAMAKYGAAENVAEIKEAIEAQRAETMQLGYITVGVNPEAKPFFLDHQMALGVVGAHFANNSLFGGKIKDQQYYIGGFSQRATLEVDGKKLVDKGRIMMK